MVSFLEVGRGVCIMGRPRKPEEEKQTTIFLRLPNPLLWKLENEAGAEGKAQEAILKILLEYFEKKDCQKW